MNASLSGRGDGEGSITVPKGDANGRDSSR